MSFVVIIHYASYPMRLPLHLVLVLLAGITFNAKLPVNLIGVLKLHCLKSIASVVALLNSNIICTVVAGALRVDPLKLQDPINAPVVDNVVKSALKSILVKKKVLPGSTI